MRGKTRTTGEFAQSSRFRFLVWPVRPTRISLAVEFSRRCDLAKAYAYSDGALSSDAARQVKFNALRAPRQWNGNCGARNRHRPTFHVESRIRAPFRRSLFG